MRIFTASHVWRCEERVAVLWLLPFDDIRWLRVDHSCASVADHFDPGGLQSGQMSSQACPDGRLPVNDVCRRLFWREWGVKVVRELVVAFRRLCAGGEMVEGGAVDGWVRGSLFDHLVLVSNCCFLLFFFFFFCRFSPLFFFSCSFSLFFSCLILLFFFSSVLFLFIFSLLLFSYAFSPVLFLFSPVFILFSFSLIPPPRTSSVPHASNFSSAI